MRNLFWTPCHRKTLYEGRIFSLHLDCAKTPDGQRQATFDVMTAPDWVNVVTLTDDEQVVLIHQFRHGTKQVTVEIPGGTVDPGEGPLDTGVRELLEETGYEAEDWKPIGVVDPNPAFLTNRTYTYLASGARCVREQDLGENEDIVVVERPLADVPGLIADGTITHALVVAAFFHLANHRGVGF